MIHGDENGVQFKDFCWEEWKAKYSTSPPWGKAEFVVLHEARQRLDTEDLARAAWTKFLASTDPFHEGHSPKKFLYSLSQMTARALRGMPPRERRDKIQDDGPWADRTAYLIQLHKEVNADDSIHELKKRDEVSRRFKARFPN